MSYKDVVIKVTPEELYAKSDDIRHSTESMNKRFQNMKNIVKRSSSYWEGEAKNSYVSVYESFQEEIQETIARLTEHVEDLNKMAGVYQSAEKEAQEIAASLPDDVII